jgi:hypothetical protein
VTTLRFLDRYPFNSPWIRTQIARHWLAVWFLTESMLGLAQSLEKTTYLYFDARLYILATRAWLSGEDPWSTQIRDFYFAAPPPTLLPFAPLTVLSDDQAVAVVALLVVLGAIATVRMLRLPWYWVLFPPLTQAMLSANVQALLIPLILIGQGPLASFLKVYAAVPLAVLGRWRALFVAAIALVISAPVLPWATFFDRLPWITASLAEQTHYALPTAVLVAAVPFALIALAIVGRERAAWLVVPALWPSQQFYYGTLAMGARSAVAAALVALPVPGSGLLALLVLAAVTVRAEGPPPWWPWWARVPWRLGPSAR